MSQANSEIVVALDIGTTKVCAIAGKMNEYGKIEILGIGKVESPGVLRGVVSNIEKTVQAIEDACNIVERQLGEEIKVIHVGIAGQHIKSLQHRGIITRDTDDEIKQYDIDRLVNDMYKLVLPPGDKIIHVIPQEFTVDNEQGILEPIGMSGVRLEANFHIITGQISASKNINRCVERAGLDVASLTLEPIASAASILSDEEREAGVALVDIGGGTTDLAIFHEGIIRHTAVIPFGGNVITKDIKEGCTVMLHQAEKLKVKFGSALSSEVFDNRIITIPGISGRDPKEISEKNLARIIEARIEEIFDHVYFEIRRSGLERQLKAGGIVLTGGGALLRNVDKLVEYHTGMPTRIGMPIERLAHGYVEKVASPIYSTAIGLLLHGIAENKRVQSPKVEAKKEVVEEDVYEPVEEYVHEESDGGSFLNKLFKKTKEWFEAEPDQGIE